MDAIPRIDTHRKVWPTDYEADNDNGKGLRCFRCGCKRWKVTHTRAAPDGSVWRRRQCCHCGAVRSTYER